jgi:hypothetical protein
MVVSVRCVRLSLYSLKGEPGCAFTPRPGSGCAVGSDTIRTPLLEFDDLVEGVVTNTIDHFSSVVDHQLLEEHPGLLAVVLQP